jgi:hypothetical protein
MLRLALLALLEDESRIRAFIYHTTARYEACQGRVFNSRIGDLRLPKGVGR